MGRAVDGGKPLLTRQGGLSIRWVGERRGEERRGAYALVFFFLTDPLPLSLARHRPHHAD